MGTPATRAIVTGATGTVGRACALALGERGCRLTLLGRRLDALQAVAASLAATGAEVETRAFDHGTDRVLDVPPAWRSERLLLVNAAAVFGPLTSFADADIDAWTAAVTVDLLGAARLIHAVLPVMVETGWGRIVQVSSAAARDVPGPFNTAYVVSKLAVDRLLAQLATELVGSGVTVCSLHPGEIASAMRDDIAAQAGVDRRLDGWTSWAERTAAHGDDPTVAANWVARLLDDDVAAALNGRFGYPQQSGRSEPL
jgi:NAD(P)-dependent dehydrogenase (short-subunit alcohol dehydrogenase family)